jgi:predicted dehydrogenase
VSTTATRPRLGFLGVGWIGRRRLDAIVDSGVAEVAGFVDPAVDGGLASLDELLARRVDGIVIATPSALHAEQAVAALEHGVAVFSQKPLATDAAGARRVVDAARAADRLLGVDLCYRTTEAARQVKALVTSGTLGDVVAAELVFHNAYGPNNAWSADPALAGGGCLLDLGTHLVDLALWTLGFPAVRRVAASLRGEPLEHYAAAQLEVEGGAAVRLACSWQLHLGRGCAFEASIYGTRGGTSMRNVDGSFFDFTAERHDGDGRTLLAAPPDDWGGRAAVEWAERVGAGEGFDEAAEEYVRVHDLLDRIYGRSA